MDCRRCGTQLRAGASFCHVCGASTDAGGSADETAATRPPAAGRGEGADGRGPHPVEAAPVDTGPVDTGSVDTDPNMTQVAAGREDGTLACPRCGSPNLEQRLLCGRCGADLQTGEPGQHAAPRFDPGPSDVPGPDASPAEVTATWDGGPGQDADNRTILAAVVGVAVVIGAVIGVVLLTGRIGGEELAQPPAFDQPPQRLVARQAVASSSGGEASGSGLVADGDVSTAWRAAEGAGAGEAVELSLDAPAWIQELQLAVGDQAGDGSFEALARPTRIRIRFGDDQPVVAELQDQPGVQAVGLDPPRRSQQLRIEILDVAGGTQDDTVAISEVALRGHPTSSTGAAAAAGG